MQSIPIRSPGVYVLTNTVNQKKYVGSTVNLYSRTSDHIRHLRRQIHHCQPLQRAFNKHGEEAFSFCVLEQCEKHLLVQREQHWIDTLNVTDSERGYNVCKTAGSVLGRVVTQETRRKIAQKLIGKVHSVETRAKISAVQKGRKASPETRAKHQAFRHSDEAKQKIRKAGTGRPCTQTARDKSRASQLGKAVSDETRKRLSESHKGIRLSQQAKDKVSAANKGKKLTPEHIAKIASTNKVRMRAIREQQQTVLPIED